MNSDGGQTEINVDELLQGCYRVFHRRPYFYTISKEIMNMHFGILLGIEYQRCKMN